MVVVAGRDRGNSSVQGARTGWNGGGLCCAGRRSGVTTASTARWSTAAFLVHLIACCEGGRVGEAGA
eukprot:9888907-Prorocentrum_lima.AAC.1